MARERMVTRTVNLTVAEVMTVNTTTAEVQTVTVEVSGGLSTDKEIMRAVKAAHETEDVKCVKLMNVSVKEVLYGMTEAEFIRLAKVLPPRSVKDEG